MKRIWSLIWVLTGTLGIADTWAAWDDLPRVNTAQGVNNIFNLNFSSAGSRQQIALFLINSNDPAGFKVHFTFGNKGNFKAGTRSIPILTPVLNYVSGTLGPGLDPLAVDHPLVINGGTGIATWTLTGALPTGATVNYMVEIDVGWASYASGLAGLYLETINATVESGM